jgi:hypothetical protein
MSRDHRLGPKSTVAEVEFKIKRKVKKHVSKIIKNNENKGVGVFGELINYRKPIRFW